MPPKPIGSVIIDGCLPSAGYIWCEILNQCIRTWITICEIPTECLTWNDGCNTCSVTDGKIGACTEMVFPKGSTSMYCLDSGNNEYHACS